MINKHWLFPENLDEARVAQREMAQNILLKDDFKGPILHIAGMDVSNTPFDPNQMIFGSSVVLSYPSLDRVEVSNHAEKQEFPYITGMLGFREVPALKNAYDQLSVRPDIVMIDGHGVSHPRGLGVASHVGVLLDIPTIGIAKSILVGEPAVPLSEEAGSSVPLVYKGKVVGMIVRTKKRCAPLIISAGHKVTLQTAVQLVMNCLKGYKLPEPTRQAHLEANKHRLSFK